MAKKKVNDTEVKDVVAENLEGTQESMATELGTSTSASSENEEGKKVDNDLPGAGESETKATEKDTELDTQAEKKGAGKKGNKADPEINKKRDTLAKEVFSRNPRSSTLYFTADLIPFFEKSDALRHANSLENKTVVTINKK